MKLTGCLNPDREGRSFGFVAESNNRCKPYKAGVAVAGFSVAQ